jgi:hypothetical protein
VTGVTRAQRVGLAGLTKAFLTILADGLEEAIAGLGPVFLGDHQGPGDQARKALEDQVWIDPVATTDRFGGVEGAAAGEHRQPAQEPPLRVVQQLIRPVDRGP